MNGLSADLRKTVSLAAAVIGAVVCVVSLFFTDSKGPMALGVVTGTCVSIINFNIMALAGEKAIELPPEKARVKMTVNYLIRYGLYIVVLIVAFKVSFFNVVGTVLGFFTSILALYLTQVLNTPGNRDKIKKLLSRAK